MNSFSGILNRVGWKFLLAHRWLLVLMIAGIALGVGVMVSVDIANLSAEKSFTLSTEAVTGRATHQIISASGKLDEEIYFQFVKSGWNVPVTPVITLSIVVDKVKDRPLTLLGVDPFTDSKFRGYFQDGLEISTIESTDLLTLPGAIIISKSLADDYGLGLGESLSITFGDVSNIGLVTGIIDPPDPLTKLAMETTIITDISSAQELTGTTGRINRIDLILPEQDSIISERIQEQLPQGILLDSTISRTGSLKEMTAAFRLNLTALSLLAMLVGLFLIYNSMTFAVLERRELFGILRCLGVTRGEIFRMVVVEAILVGIVGSIAGLGLGIILGRITVGMVSQTISDLYYRTAVTTVLIPWESLVKGFVAGVGSTALAAAFPAWEAGSVSPRLALQRVNIEIKALKSVAWAGWIGMAFILIGTASFLIPNAGMLLGFGGTFLIVIGFALNSAWATGVIMRISARVFGKIFGFAGKIAPRNLAHALSRTSVAIASLLIAIAVTIGVDLMIQSFRTTVVQWMEQVLQSDVYITSTDLNGSNGANEILPEVMDIASGYPGVLRVDHLRSTEVNSNNGPVNLFATNNMDIGSERTFLEIRGTSDDLYDQMRNGSVIVSEPLSNRLNLKTGDSLQLFSLSSWQEFPIAGIYYDYGDSSGIVTMELMTYRKFWNDDSVTSMGLTLVPDLDAEKVARDIERLTIHLQPLNIQPNQFLRSEIIKIFDRTFAITAALRFLSIGVALAGILSSLMMLQLEKARETGILRALGMTNTQIGKMIFMESGLMGLTAGLLALPAGYVMALILVHVINLRSFGWTIQMNVTPQPFLWAIALSVGAALIAGIYPVYRMTRVSTIETLRME
jgi:putative ABC transport system permease protein